MLNDLIQNSFFLTKEQKEYFLEIIKEKDDIYIKKLYEYLQNEKNFILECLKEFKNRSEDIWIIKQELIQKNLKRIKELELEEKNDDLNIDFWNIF